MRNRGSNTNINIKKQKWTNFIYAGNYVQNY
jgi:hypothetical protein